ncbi:unnamed protein product [Adineta steineri]|uniref:Uncharacterized protein n=1 Tax=Adineta steineri TaxID=433720 RepID=A0A815Q5R3_9BILA|nr:unnamed protein product [Adineta steineri]CAF4067887.1 unnamed protein product [Adineta steineri]
MKEKYLTNTKLNNCSNWFHFSQWIQKAEQASPCAKRRKQRSFRHHGEKPLFHLPGKVTATIIEALLAATDRFHQKNFTRHCVLGLMELMENKIGESDNAFSYIVGCGAPVYTDIKLTHITGLLTCDPNHPYGVCFMDSNAIIHAMQEKNKRD